MHKTFHLTSAEDLNNDIIEAIKIAFKSKPIRIIVEEDDEEFDLTVELISVLDNRVNEKSPNYIKGSDSIEKLNKKYGL